MGTFGVIYVAFGAPYLAMAITSLVSLKVTNPTVPVCIVTNVVRDMPDKPWWRPEDGDTWIYLDNETERNRHAKTSVYQLSPFDLTLFLDCDTMVLGDLSPIPRYLEYFDILLSAVYNPTPTNKRILDGKFRYTEDGHFNSGVFAFRRSQPVESFFALWNERFHALGSRLDQPSLLEAYYLGNVRMFPLSAKWNSGDRWATPGDVRNQIVIWHYKVRMEPLLERIAIKSVDWFGGTKEHSLQAEQFFQDRRKNRYLRSPGWLIRRLVTKIRGDQSRRLEKHPNKDRWIEWTR